MPRAGLSLLVQPRHTVLGLRVARVVSSFDASLSWTQGPLAAFTIRDDFNFLAEARERTTFIELLRLLVPGPTGESCARRPWRPSG